ncbi:MAG: Hint domain-containing protein [Sulfitobacter sp.]
MVTASELPITTVREGTSAMDMANEIFGEGVTVNSATFSGDRDSAGIYSNGIATSPGVVPSDRGVILSTGEAEDFTNSSGQANQWQNTSTTNGGLLDIIVGDVVGSLLSGASTHDQSVLDVDFTPDSTQMTLQFVFASEEYPEFETTNYQDFFGVWVNGQQIDIDVGDGDVDPRNINSDTNGNLFIDNQAGTYNTEMDGFTVTMSMTVDVIPGATNSIRFAVVDVNDANYDSNLLIAADSVQSSLIAVTDVVQVYPNGDDIIDALANDINTGTGTITVTHVNGIAVSTGSTVTLPTGQLITLNADGTFGVSGDGDTESFDFTYAITNGTSSATGYVNATSVPCFVAGTLIRTPQGERAVETLRPGDLVLTKDDGPQPLRWTGNRTVAAKGDFAPVHIAAGTFGDHAALMVSPLHRILIKDELAELLFGNREVLICARDLLNDKTVTRRPGGDVTYVHLLFDRHQVVFSQGLETESFLPGPQTSASFEAEAMQEIMALFPELDPQADGPYPPAARRTLRRFEAELLLKEKAA